MPRVSCIGAAVILLVLSHQSAAQDDLDPTAVGNAYDQDSGHFLYSEQHFCSDDSNVCTVKYLDSFGLMIAQKQLDYSDSLVGPSLVMNDYRQGIELSLAGSSSQDLVVDAGFDNYVRSKWDELSGGDDVRFPFLVVGFKKPLKMLANREAEGACDDDTLCLSISLDSWLLGLLAAPIELSYSRDSKKLLRFSGVSNIKGAAGETLNVDIHYQYDNDILLVGPLERKVPPAFEL